MVSFNANSSREQYKFINNTVQNNSENCSINTTVQQQGQVFIADGVKFGNNACIQCVNANTDSTCLITSGMQDSITQALTTLTQVANKTGAGWFNNFKYLSAGVNVSNIRESSTNNVTQINNASCTINNTISQQGQYIYLTNSTAGDNFKGQSADANFTSGCNMNNTMTSITQGNTDRKFLAENVKKSMFVAIAAIFAGVVGLVIIGAVFLFATGAIGHVGYSSSGSSTAPVSQNSEEALAASLGIDPEILAEAEGIPMPSTSPSNSSPGMKSSSSSTSFSISK
jgi:hypothetical protein